MHCCNDLIPFWFLFGFPKPVLVPSLSLVFNLKICLKHCSYSPAEMPSYFCMLDSLLSICFFKTGWNIILLLFLPPRKLSRSLSLLPPHLVIKEPLHKHEFAYHSWTGFSSIQTRTSAHVSGNSSWRSSYLFKVSILKQEGFRVCSNLVPSIYFPGSMNSMITLGFLSFPSTVSPSAEVTLWVSPYRLYLNSTVTSPWQKWHLRYILFYPNWKALNQTLMILRLTYTFLLSGLDRRCSNDKV